MNSERASPTRRAVAVIAVAFLLVSGGLLVVAPAEAHNLGGTVWDSGWVYCSGYGRVTSYQQGDNKHFIAGYTSSVAHTHGYRSTVYPWISGSNSWSAWGADLNRSLTSAGCFQ